MCTFPFQDPLNSGDDVSEQEVPDLFDTENVIVCQYDKVNAFASFTYYYFIFNIYFKAYF